MVDGPAVACPTDSCAPATNSSLALCPNIRFGYPRSIEDERKLIAAVSEATAEVPYSFLTEVCGSSLSELTCMSANLSCAYGTPLPRPCRSVCQSVEDACGPIVMAVIRAVAPAGIYDCDQYADDEWPACASVVPDASLLSSCEAPPHMPPSPQQPPWPPGAAPPSPPPPPPLLPFPSMPPLPWDACTIDGCGCDEQGGEDMRFDACGRCRYSSKQDSSRGACTDLDPDPHVVTYVCVAAAAGFGALVLCVLAIHAFHAVDMPWSRRKPPSSRGSWHALGTLPHDFAAWQSKVFGRWGRFVAQRPRTVLLLTTVCAAAATFGLMSIKVHGDPLTMWLPSDSGAQINEREYTRLTGRPRPRSLLVLIEGARSESFNSTNAVKAALQQAMTIHETAISCGFANVSAGSGLSATDGIFSPLLLWGYSRVELQRDRDPLGTILTALESKGINGGIAIDAIGSMLRLSPPSAAQPAETELEAMLLAFNVDGAARSRHRAVAFERCVRNELLVSEPSQTWPGLADVHVFSESALSDDLYATVGTDTFMMVGSMVLMSAYVSLFISRHWDTLRCRASLSGAAVLSVVLATFSAFGIGAALGIEYNDNVNMAVFVILGVGIDDAFVIVKALDDLPAPASTNGDQDARVVMESMPARVGAALAACGSAILLSSTTNAIAFALGARSPLPALQGFCAYAALGMVLDFLFQISFFVAAVAVDEQRRSCDRSALVPCLHTKGARVCTLPNQLQHHALARPASRHRLRLFSACTLCMYLCTLALATYASWYVRVGFQPSQLVSRALPVARFFQAQERLFADSPQLVEVLVMHERPPRASEGEEAMHEQHVQGQLQPLSAVANETLALLRSLRGALHATKAVHQNGGRKAISNLWVDVFTDSLRERGLVLEQLSAAARVEELAAFLLTPEATVLASTGSAVVRDGVLIATSWRLMLDDYGPEAMLRLRSALELAGASMSALAFSANDIFYEQDAGLLAYTRESLVMVFTAVLGAVMFLTLNVGFVCLMGVCTLSCVAHLVGWMLLTGIKLSSISMVPLLLSIGLCIDYCTHIAHAYAEATGDPIERTLVALRTRGVAVLNAGISTGLSVLLLAFGESAIFTTFFWLLLGVVVVGLFHALLVLPACFSLLPSSHTSHRRARAAATNGCGKSSCTYRCETSSVDCVHASQVEVVEVQSMQHS